MTGDELLEARMGLGYDQKTMGDMIGVSPSQISKWEKGRANISKGYQFRIEQVLKAIHVRVVDQDEMDIATSIIDHDSSGKPITVQDQAAKIDAEDEESAAKQGEAETIFDDSGEWDENSPTDPWGFSIPTIERDGFKIVEFQSLNHQGKAILEDAEGRHFMTKNHNYLRHRRRGTNPSPFANVVNHRRKSRWVSVKKKDWEIDRNNLKKFTDNMIKTAFSEAGISEGDPKSYDKVVMNLIEEKGASEKVKNMFQKELLDKIPDENKIASVSELIGHTNEQLGKALFDAFNHEEAKPLLEMLEKQLEKRSSEIESSARDEFLRQEHQSQEEKKQLMIEYNSKIASLQKDLLSKTTLAAVTQTSLERAEEGLKTANKLADHKDEMLTDLKSQLATKDAEIRILRERLNELMKDDVDIELMEKRRQMWSSMGYSDSEILKLERYIKEDKK